MCSNEEAPGVTKKGFYLLVPVIKISDFIQFIIGDGGNFSAFSIKEVLETYHTYLRFISRSILPMKTSESILIKKEKKKPVGFIIYPLDRTITIHLGLLSVPEIADLKNLMSWTWFSPSLCHHISFYFFSFLPSSPFILTSSPLPLSNGSLSLSRCQ